MKKITSNSYHKKMFDSKTSSTLTTITKPNEKHGAHLLGFVCKVRNNTFMCIQVTATSKHFFHR